MRIIHTADWHLCDRLGHVNRTVDLKSRVAIVADLCERHSADVLLIAGDLFSERVSREEITDALTHLRLTFKGYFARNGTILAVTGNHDKNHVVEPVRAGMGLAAPAGAPIGSTLAPGRMYLFNAAWFGKLRGTHDDFDTQFVMLPYPYPSRYLEEHERRECHTAEEENRAVHGRIAAWLKNLPENHQKYDETARTVLAAHIHVVGADISRGLFRMSEQDDVLLDGATVPVWPDYVALGHIHKAQCIGGLPHVRYSGSLDRLDFGERDDDRGVVLVDIGAKGRRGNPEVLAIAPTLMYDVSITNPAVTEDELRSQYPQADKALARITVHYRPGTDSRETLEHTIRSVFPRFTTIDWREAGIEAEPGSRAVSPKADYRLTVRQYLERRLEKDEQKEALLQLAETYLGDEEEGCE